VWEVGRGVGDGMELGSYGVQEEVSGFVVCLGYGMDLAGRYMVEGVVRTLIGLLLTIFIRCLHWKLRYISSNDHPVRFTFNI